VAAGGSARAAAGTYYVTTSGDDGHPCTQALPCLTIGRALAAHRVAPDPGDIIDVGPGTFVENVVATNAADNGLTIRGTLGGGTRQTTIRGSGFGSVGGLCPVQTSFDAGCVVRLGAGPSTAVTLQDINVDTEGADSRVRPISAEGGSDLLNVHASLGTGSAALFVIRVGGPGTVVDQTTLDGGNTSVGSIGIDTSGGATVRDSHVIATSTGILQPTADDDPISVTRSWIETPGGARSIQSGGDLTLDSSLLTGGTGGPSYFGTTAVTWLVRNTTIDIGTPGVYDGGGVFFEPDLYLQPAAGGNVDVTVDSSLLVEEIANSSTGGIGTVTCTHTDFQLLRGNAAIDASQCVSGANGNTTTDPAQQFVGGAPFDWSLKDGAPAIDAGTPGALPVDQSTTDLAGNARRQPTDPACLVRDQGAYEHASVSCRPRLFKLPVIEGATSPVAGVKLRSYSGGWQPAATSYAREWLRCDPGNIDDCTAIPGKTHTTYIPTNNDAGFVLRLRVVATNATGSSDPATSAPTGVVSPSVPVVKQNPTITGHSPPAVGDVLTSFRGEWLPVPSSYRRSWLRCNTAGDSCITIGSATGTTYRVRPKDAGHRIRVQVIATNTFGDSQPARSTATSTVS
jgi:hypothetical protein